MHPFHAVALAAVSVVAAAPPITAAPRIVAWTSASNLTGAFAGARHDDPITIEARTCGATQFSHALDVPADPEGGWHVFVAPTITTEYRARFRGEVTDGVTVQVRPSITVRELSPGRFAVTVLALKQFWRRTGVLERFDRPTQRWRRAKTFVFDDTGSTSGTTSYSKARVRARLPRGVLVRATLPSSQVRPCYVAGVSNMLRTK